MRSLARVVGISVGDSYEQNIRISLAETGGWVGERQKRDITETGEIGRIKIPVHTMYADPEFTEQILEDTNFDLEADLADQISRIFAEQEGQAFISGDGRNKPQGLLTGNIKRVKSGKAKGITADALLAMIYSLPAAYSANGTFLWERSTTLAVRILKDSTGRYLWDPGINGGASATVAGVPYKEEPFMPAIDNGNIAIAYGDFNRGYTIVDRAGIAMKRDDITNKGFVNFYTTKRVGGGLTDTNALRVMEIE